MEEKSKSELDQSIFGKSIKQNKEKINESLKFYSELVTNTAKIWITLSVLFSGVFITTYLKQFNLPFIPIDNVLPFIIQTFALTFAYFYITTILYFLVPLTFPYIISGHLRAALPNLFSLKYEKDNPFHITAFFSEYVSFYFPIVSLITILILLSVVNYVRDISDTQMSVFTLIVFASGFLFLTRLNKYKILTLFGKSEVIFWFLFINLITGLWTTVIAQVISKIASQNIKSTFGGTANTVLAIGILAFITVSHISCHVVSVQKSGRIILAFISFGIFLLCAWPGPGRVGGFILRFAGYGGGTVFSYQVEKDRPLKGCLVWLSSNYLVIADRSKDDTCASNFSDASGRAVTQPVHMLRRDTVQVLMENGLP